jgi:long-chain acyl-CoA synthetase
VRLAELLVLQSRFDPEDFLAAIARHRITHVYAVPTMFVRLLALAPEVRTHYDLSSLRFVLHAGGPCPASVKDQMIAWLGPVINEYYGSTEHGPLTFCSSTEWLAHRGTVGRAPPYVEISIQDDGGVPVSVGIAGEILARNTANPDFTYHGREAERHELQRGELIKTGDVGYLDADGFLYLCDRKRDVVISGGVNIYPAEIEGVLAVCPGVADSAVFGVPDPVFGESLMAIVQPRSGVSLDINAVRDFVAERLASYKVPGSIEIRDALPREESGKIRKRLLRDPHWRNV